MCGDDIVTKDRDKDSSSRMDWQKTMSALKANSFISSPQRKGENHPPGARANLVISTAAKIKRYRKDGSAVDERHVSLGLSRTPILKGSSHHAVVMTGERGIRDRNKSFPSSSTSNKKQSSKPLRTWTHISCVKFDVFSPS